MATPAGLELLTADVSGRTQWRVVRLRWPDGRVGLGEASDSGNLPTAVAAMENLRPHLQQLPDLDGCSPDVVRAWADAGLDVVENSRFARAVLGGVEQAVCDLAAQQAGQPVWEWLGALDLDRPTLVPCYANINRIPGGRRPSDLAAAAGSAARHGFTTVKCAPWDVPVDGVPLPMAGLERLRAARATLGDDVELLVDCHLRLELADLLPLLPALEELRLGWLEDAVDSSDLAGLREVRARSELRLVGGEFSYTAEELLPAVSERLLDVVLLDVKHAGGITRARRLADQVHAANPDVVVSPHNPSGPVGTVASAHLLMASPHAGLLEVAFGETPARAQVIEPSEQIRHSQLPVSAAPGLGIGLTPDGSGQLPWSTVWSDDSEVAV